MKWINAWLLLLGLGLFITPSKAQLNNPGVIYVVVDPTGSCGYGTALRYNYTNSDLSGCLNGTWAVINGGSAGPGTVTNVSVVSANGVSGTVANPTTTPAITVVLGAITPTSVAASGAVSGSSLSAGASPPAVTGNGILGMGEATGQGCVAGADCLIADSATHRFLVSNNNATAVPLVVGPASVISGHAVTFNGTTGGIIQDGGALPTGTVTSVGTTAPLGGGTITGTGTITCSTCVVASSPGIGLAHFAGSTQTVTSSLVSLTADVTGLLPIANGGTGTATPSLVAGTNVTVTGTWPNQTVNASGGGSSGLTINTTTISGGATNAFLYGDGTTLQNEAGLTRTGVGQMTATQTGLGTTAADAFKLVNTTAAATGAQQISPSVHWQGQGWKTTATAASQPVDWISYVLPVQGSTSPTSQLILAASINGGSYTNALTVTNPNTASNNNVTMTLGNASVTTNNVSWGFSSTVGTSSGFALNNASRICWVTSPLAGCGGTEYASLSQTTSTSSIIQVGSGAPGSGGSFRAASFQSGGTTFTISGCSATTPVGGATAGSFLSGTTGACTVVITLNGATGLTATNGWSCHAADLTTPANLISQSASNATTCTITGTTVSGDKIQFMAMAF